MDLNQLYETITHPDVTMWTPLATIGVVLGVAIFAIFIFLACYLREPAMAPAGIIAGCVVAVPLMFGPHEDRVNDHIEQALAQYTQDHYDVVPIEKARVRTSGSAWFRAVDDDGQTVYVTIHWDPSTPKPIVKGTTVPTNKTPVTFRIDDTKPDDWRK